MNNYLVRRLSERTTWMGLVSIFTLLFGLTLSEEDYNKLVQALTVIFSIVLTFFPETPQQTVVTKEVIVSQGDKTVTAKTEETKPQE